MSYDSQLRKAGAASLSPPSKGNSGLRHQMAQRGELSGLSVSSEYRMQPAGPPLYSPTGGSSSDTAPSAGGLPAHQPPFWQFCFITLGIPIASIVAVTHYIRHGDFIFALVLGILYWSMWVAVWWYLIKPVAKRKSILGPSVPSEYPLLMPSSPTPASETYCPITGEFGCIRHECPHWFDEPPMKTGCHYQAPEEVEEK